MKRPMISAPIPLLFSLVAATAMLKRQEPQVTMGTSDTGQTVINFEFVAGQQVGVKLGKKNILAEMTITMRVGREPSMGASKALAEAGFDTALIERDLEKYSHVMFGTIPYAGILLADASITLAQISQTSPFFGVILEKLVNADVVHDATTNRYGLIAADIDLVASASFLSRRKNVTKLVAEAA